jgi:hypothetical protein
MSNIEQTNHPLWGPSPGRKIAGLRRDVEMLKRRPVLRYVPIHIKMYADTRPFTAGDDAFVFEIDSDTHTMRLWEVAAYVTTVGTTATTIQFRNKTQGDLDMLSTVLTIDANELRSSAAATPPVINETNERVAFGDFIAIDIDSAGTGAKGLGIRLKFHP